MAEAKIYRLGHNYIDDIANSRHIDQFVKWLPGIGNSKGIRCAKFKKFKSEIPAFVVLITREVAHKHHNPWDDIIDYNSSKIFYWGDAKYHTTKNYRSFIGNKTLVAVYERYLDGNKFEIPPILHFSKRKKGEVTFNGLCVITNVETTWFEDNQIPVKNFRFELTILDEEKISVDWIISRNQVTSFKELNISIIPNAWKIFLNGRLEKLNIFKPYIKSRGNQMPVQGSEEEMILKALIKLKPVEFEAVLIAILKALPHIIHKIAGTRHVKDGGFDFFGEFSIPYPLGYKIGFLGEAKKYNLNNAIGPGLVSRLVARLGRGQYGIFITTSYYTSQAQQEVLEDAYPVRLYSGIDVVNFLRELKFIDGGKIKEEWVNAIINSNRDD